MVSACAARAPYRVGVVALFPEIVSGFLAAGINARAQHAGRVVLHTWNIRDQAHDKHRTVDDRPYGGGPGMVLKCQPVADTIRKARAAMPGCPVVYLSPQGRLFNQAWAAEMAEWPGLICLAGRYEGIDERVLETEVDAECSIGDYVLSGGESAVCVVLDTLIRLLPGSVHDPESVHWDSFGTGWSGQLDCPHYTRPRVFEGRAVPDVLLSGDHAAIAAYRAEASLRNTREKRPDIRPKGDQVAPDAGLEE